MNRLSYPGQEDRKERQAAVIGRLVAKGWTDHGPIAPTPITEEQAEANRKAAIRDAANERVNAVITGDKTHLLMRALLRVRRENGNSASSADKAELDQLEAAATYVEAVRMEEARLINNASYTVEDATWPTL